MTIKAIRENLEQAREGLQEMHYGDRYTDDGYVVRTPGLHEAKLYSICEGLIVEIERLQARLEVAERHRHHYRGRTWNGSNATMATNPPYDPGVAVALNEETP